MSKLLLAFAIPAVLLAGVGLAEVFPTVSNQGYAPDQPIPFSHKLHAGTYKMDCQYCHSAPEKSRHSTIPAVSVCMNCHSVVKTDSPWIQQIKKHYDENKPIEWVRIHELPDYAYFPHKRHVGRGIACQTCHGPVQEMDKVFQYSPLTMGWCMDCHRGVTTPKHILNELPADAQPDARGRRHVATVNCSACHH